MSTCTAAAAAAPAPAVALTLAGSDSRSPRTLVCLSTSLLPCAMLRADASPDELVLVLAPAVFASDACGLSSLSESLRSMILRGSAFSCRGRFESDRVGVEKGRPRTWAARTRASAASACASRREANRACRIDVPTAREKGFVVGASRRDISTHSEILSSSVRSSSHEPLVSCDDMRVASKSADLPIACQLRVERWNSHAPLYALCQLLPGADLVQTFLWLNATP